MSELAPSAYDIDCPECGYHLYFCSNQEYICIVCEGMFEDCRRLNGKYLNPYERQLKARRALTAAQAQFKMTNVKLYKFHLVDV